MKNFKVFFSGLSLVLILIIVMVSSCKKADDDNNDDNNQPFQYPEVTLTHNGYSFVLGMIDTVNYESDGETIGWMPGSGTNPTYPNNTSYIWWRNSHLDQVNYQNMTKDMGAVELNTITTIPTSWDTVPDILPLLPGHSIVAKCQTGHVKFQVISADTSMMWPAQVKYYYTTGSTFDK